MILEERFEVLMKNYEEMSIHNKEMKNQNSYLRHKLGDVMKQRRKDILSSPSSNTFEICPGGRRGKMGQLPWFF